MIMSSRPALAVAVLGALALLAGLAGPADAAGRARKYKQAPKPQPRHQAPRDSGRGDYQELIADKLPFGSTIWWEQMNRERRGGRPG
jgi:hypothetical protein